jgi:hypothetical protein
MVIHSQQEKEAQLYPELDDGDSTVMVLSGGPKSALVHTYTQGPGILPTWQKCFLIEDWNALSAAEKTGWFGDAGPENYIVFGGENTAPAPGAPNRKKLEGDRGATSSLMVSDTKVNKTAVSDAFGKGDAL